MKTCPNCGEWLGNNADSCFKCRYDFKTGKVISIEEERKQQGILEEQIRLKEQQRQEIEAKRKEREETVKKEKIEFIQKLPLYEYATEVITDDRSGGINRSLLNETLARYAKECWRLHTALSNELGKNSSSVGYGGISYGTNATIDQTILIFERMISKGNL